jgi:hypothetical protein
MIDIEKLRKSAKKADDRTDSWPFHEKAMQKLFTVEVVNNLLDRLERAEAFLRECADEKNIITESKTRADAIHILEQAK